MGKTDTLYITVGMKKIVGNFVIQEQIQNDTYIYALTQQSSRNLDAQRSRNSSRNLKKYVCRVLFLEAWFEVIKEWKLIKYSSIGHWKIFDTETQWILCSYKKK